MHTYKHTYIHTYWQGYKRIFYIGIYRGSKHRQMCTYIPTQIRTNIDIDIDSRHVMDIHTYIHTYIHTSLHNICTHICLHSCNHACTHHMYINYIHTWITYIHTYKNMQQNKTQHDTHAVSTFDCCIIGKMLAYTSTTGRAFVRLSFETSAQQCFGLFQALGQPKTPIIAVWPVWPWGRRRWQVYVHCF